MDISKAIDKEAGVTREVVGTRYTGNKGGGAGVFDDDNYNWDKPFDATVPKTEAAKQWQGWGTALKPAWEPILVCRKPVEGTVAQNVQKYGTGGINVDACRVEAGEEHFRTGVVGRNGGYTPADERRGSSLGLGEFAATNHPGGRWPANLIHDGSDEVLSLFPDVTSGAGIKRPAGSKIGNGVTHRERVTGYSVEGVGGDSGSAARFFYCAKAAPLERGENNLHPTVKPIELMRYLITLVAAPNAIVLDPFMGSGSTGVAAALLQRRFVGIELEEKYFETCQRRITEATAKGAISAGFGV